EFGDIGLVGAVIAGTGLVAALLRRAGLLRILLAAAGHHLALGLLAGLIALLAGLHLLRHGVFAISAVGSRLHVAVVLLVGLAVLAALAVVHVAVVAFALLARID